MADNEVIDTVVTTSDKNIKIVSSKEQKVKAVKTSVKASSGGDMPPPITWTKALDSNAGTSNTFVSDSSKSNLYELPKGHALSRTSAAGSPMDRANNFPGLSGAGVPYMLPPSHGLQFLQSPNPAYGGYLSPPPYGFHMPYAPFPGTQTGFAQPSFEEEEVEEEVGEQLDSPPDVQEGEDDSDLPIPASLLASKVKKRSVQSALVDRISDALYDTDYLVFKSLRDLAVDNCCLPSNMTHPIPKLEGKLLTYMSKEGIKEDEALAKTQESLWMLLQPVIRSFEKVRGSSTSQKETIMHLLQISIQGYCAMMSEWTRKRRTAVKKDCIGYVDFRSVIEADIPPASDLLFGGLLTNASFPQKRTKGKILKIALKRKGLSDKVIETISKSKRDVTAVQYDRVMEKYYAWCKVVGRAPFGDDISTPLEFMQFLMDEEIKPTHGKDKRGYSCLRIATSALSALLSFEGLPFGQHHLSKAFMKGVLNERPISHRYQVQWDAERVIQKLKNKPFIPAFRIPLLLLAKKTLFLILMATSRRVHISKALCVTNDKCIRTKDRVLFHIERKDLKQGGP